MVYHGLPRKDRLLIDWSTITRGLQDYPQPIVDHKDAREEMAQRPIHEFHHGVLEMGRNPKQYVVINREHDDRLWHFGLPYFQTDDILMFQLVMST